MKAENLRTLAHELRADPTSYDQTLFYSKTRCGTVCCIAGHAAILSGAQLSSDLDWEAAGIAQEWLEIDTRLASRLFAALPHLEFKGCVQKCCPSEPAPWGKKWGRRYGAALKGESAESPALVAADLLEALAEGKVAL